jgi:hypothetical protein
VTLVILDLTKNALKRMQLAETQTLTVISNHNKNTSPSFFVLPYFELVERKFLMQCFSPPQVIIQSYLQPASQQIIDEVQADCSKTTPEAAALAVLCVWVVHESPITLVLTGELMIIIGGGQIGYKELFYYCL